ncbi:hypothetical protein NN561_010885 [Cricetulus griseus]
MGMKHSSRCLLLRRKMAENAVESTESQNLGSPAPLPCPCALDSDSDLGSRLYAELGWVMLGPGLLPAVSRPSPTAAWALPFKLQVVPNLRVPAAPRRAPGLKGPTWWRYSSPCNQTPPAHIGAGLEVCSPRVLKETRERGSREGSPTAAPFSTRDSACRSRACTRRWGLRSLGCGAKRVCGHLSRSSF